MDPSIMKLLEEDEDESMHSGADVEAFTATLMEAGTSSTHQPETCFQENNQTANQMYSQWQPSHQDKNSASQSQQQELRDHEHRGYQASSKVEAKEHAKQDVNSNQAHNGIDMQNKPMQVNSQGHQVDQNSGQFSQPLASTQMQISGKAHPQNPDQDRMHNPSSGLQSSKVQILSGNQPVSIPEHVGVSTKRQGLIAINVLLSIMLPQLDKDRAMQLQALYLKLRRNEIPGDGFLRHVGSIVGERMLQLAWVKMKAKLPNLNYQMHRRPPTGTATQYCDPCKSGHLPQKNQSTHPVAAAGPLRGPAVAMQSHKDPGHQIADSHPLKSREIQHLPGFQEAHANQMPGCSTISTQGLTKQQHEHMHSSQSSFPLYGTRSFQPYAGTHVSSPSVVVIPQPQDPQMSQVQLHQRFRSAHGDVTSQAVSASNVPTATSQHTSVPWQGMASKEQKSGASPAMSYVKQGPTEQALHKQRKASMLQSHGPTFSSSVNVEQGKGLDTPIEELSERQNSGRACSSSMRATSVTEVGSQSTLANPMGGAVGNSKASTIKAISGQKNPLDELVSSPPLPRKKKKVSGGFADQSIEHLNDVTAVGGVNLKEEEEQLFYVPKDDSRVSEASRKAVQEEEDRLILQKSPLQKKLAEIMTKCGLKNLSNDVVRCLSLCVEERLRALISSLIRVSRQRADSQKSKYRTVVTSDIREQILMINRKAREGWKKKQAEVDKFRKQNQEPDCSAAVDAENEKGKGRVKTLKVNSEEDDQLRTTAANVAARAAVGGDDMLSKWKLMAQARQKRDGGPETGSSSQVCRDANPKQPAMSAGNVRDKRGVGRKDPSAALVTPGTVRQAGRSQVTTPPPSVAPSITLKDVIAVLEREPQMAKSAIVYRLYDRLGADATTD